MNKSFEELNGQFNDTELVQPFVPVTEQIKLQAEKTPDETAVIAGDGDLTYRELERLAGLLAAALLQLGLLPETLVGFVLNRTKYVYVVEQGILRAGCAFVPMLPDYPDERVHNCMQLSDSPVLITTEAIRRSRPGLAPEGCRVMTVEELLDMGARSMENENGRSCREPEIGYDSLAVCIFTSGSTGTPKGVLIEHRTLANNVTDHEKNGPYRDFIHYGQVTAVFTPITFSVPITFDMLALSHGRTVCLADDEELFSFSRAADLILRHNVSSMFCTPSYLTSFMGTPGTDKALRALKSVSLGGEGGTLALAGQAHSINPGLTVMFGYGCSETAAAVAFKVITPDAERASIGGPLVNTTMYVLDEDGRELMPGEKGELLVCGPAIARGYLKLPEETARAFVTHRGRRGFLTGDIAMWTEDGDIVLSGRRDDMVKFHGQRVELGEIESVIAGKFGIRNIKALLRTETADDYLAVFFTADDKVDKAMLRDYLRSKLPEYMVPGVYIQLDAMPLNANGKTDRLVLLTMPLEAEIDDKSQAETETEVKLLELVKNILEKEMIGADTDLISMGLTSISAMRLSIEAENLFGVQLVMADIISQPDVRALAALIDSGSMSASVDIPSAGDRRILPLAENQRGVYLDCERDPDTTAYNIPMLYRFEDRDEEKLAEAVKAAADAHDSLKRRLVMADGEVMQEVINEDTQVTLTFLDRQPGPEFFTGKVRPFDLFGEPLYRFEVVKAPDEVYLFMDIHHLIFDGSSAEILMDDILRACDGMIPERERVSAGDLALYENELISGGRLSDCEAYFDELISGAQPVSYPADRPADGGECCEIRIRTSGKNINDFCTENKVTVNSFWHTAFAEVLSRLTREDDLLYLTVSSGRSGYRGLSHSLGMFAKTLPVVWHAGSSEPFTDRVAEAVKRMQVQLQESIRNEAYPYTFMAERHRLKSEIMFIYQGGLMESGSLQGLADVELTTGSVRFPIELTVYPDGQDYVLRLQYDGRIYGRGDMEILVRALSNAAGSLALSEYLCQAAMTDQDDNRLIEELSAGKKLDYDRSVTWVELFRRNAEKDPDRLAVADQTGQLTYGRLESDSDMVADWLKGAGIRPGDFVAVKMDRVKEFLSVILGIHKAGAAYVPVDIEYPEERIDYILEDSGAKLIITEDTLASIYPGSETGIMPAGGGQDTGSADDGHCMPFKSLAVPDMTAYMIYTSGSTGRPKGVMIRHSGLMNFIHFIADTFSVTEDSRLSCFCSFSFDVSVESLFTPLIKGGSVHIVPESARRDIGLMKDFIKEHRINGGSYPTQFGQLLGADEELDLDYICVAGERMTSVPKARGRVFNGYGPTEFTVYSTYFELDKEKGYTDIPIGRPVHNCTALVLDRYGMPVPPGARGELCLAGPQTAAGYWNRPELTGEKFAPVNGHDFDSVYHTGDLVRWNEEGQLIYTGRIDFQVKLRGFRIELGEIESTAAAFEGIKQVIAVVKNDQLCLYFTGEKGIDREKLRGFMSQRLAAYMVPGVFMQLETMPVNSNGKIERNALPEPETAGSEYIMPQTETERMIAEIVSDSLNKTDPGLNDDLIALGLSSIGAMKLAAAILRRTGKTIRTSDIMKAPFIGSIADIIDGSGTGEGPAGGSLVAYPVREYYPLMENQRGIFLEWEMDRQSTAYNISVAYRFEGVSGRRAAEAAGAAVNAHRGLNVRLEYHDGRIMQKRCEDEPEIDIIKLDHEPDQAYFTSLVRPFDLLAEKLYRICVIETAGAAWLFTDIHHIVYDGISADAFTADICRAIDGRETEEERVSALDYAIYESELRESPAYEQAEEHFDRILDGASVASYPLSADPDGCGAGSVSVTVERDRIDSFCSRHSVTAGSFWHAAFATALQRMTREEEPLYLTVSGGRSGSAGLDTTVGMLVRTLPAVLKADPAGGEEYVSDYVKRMHDQLQRSYDMEVYPYTDLVERHGLKAGIMMIYQGGLRENIELAGVDIVETEPSSVRFPVEAVIYAEEDRFRSRVIYDRSKYSSHDMEILAGAVVNTAVSMLSAEKVRDIRTVSQAEEEELIRLGRGQELIYDNSLTWVDLFLKRAAERPDHTAAADYKSSVTYAQLDRMSDRFAGYLLSQGLQAGGFVAIRMDRVKEFVIAALGIHKAGGAYVAIDNTYPEDRIKYILEDSGARIIVSEELVRKAVEEGAGDHQENEEDWKRALKTHRALPDAPAYMAYTSGSTGMPKGIVIPHRAMLNFVMFAVSAFGIDENSRQSLHCSFSSDVSLDSIYTSLISGAAVYIVPENVRKDVLLMRQFIKDNAITGGSYFTQFGQLLGADETLDLDYIALIGEKMTAVPNTRGRVFNTYGPTEFIEATFFELDKDKAYRNIPVGRPMHNCSVLVLDQYDQILPQGSLGQICLAGPQMADGYWNRSELTEKAFTFIQPEGMEAFRIYHTGDLGRWNEDGQLEFSGRIDFQVKLRGYRIEMGEVEARAADFPGILQEVAVVKNERLCLYFTGDRPVDKEELRAFMAARLAVYMVPSVFMQLDSMPLSPNGKIRREALPEPDLSAELIIHAETEEEKLLTDLAAQVLGMSSGDLGVNTDLISAGLSSLGAMKLSVAVRKASGIQLRVADIMQEPNVRALAQVMCEGGGESPVIGSYPARETYPLTENQLGVYLDWEMNRETTQYNVPFVYRFSDIDCMTLEKAVNAGVSAHGYINSVLVLQDGQAVLKRRDDHKAGVEIINEDTEPDEEYFRALVRPFDLFGDSLCRFKIINSPSAVFLFMDIHHIVFDGMSADILLTDIMDACMGGRVRTETITAFDAALYEKEMADDKKEAEAEIYYDGLLEGTQALIWPGSYQPDGRKAGRVKATLPADGIEGFCRRTGVTVSSFWHAAFAEAVHRLTREKDLMFTTISSGRYQAQGLEHTVGMFVKTLPVVMKTGGRDHGSMRTSDFVREIHSQLQKTISRDHHPYTKIVEKTGMKTGVMFAYQGALLEGGNLRELEKIDFTPDTVKFPVDMIVYPEGDSFTLSIEYDGMRYCRDDMEMLCDAVAHAAAGMTEAEYIRDVSLVDSSEKEVILKLSAGKTLDYDRSKTWVDLFSEQVRIRPDQTAVSDGHSSLSYAELDEMSERFAVWLTDQGVKPDSFIAVRMDRVKEFSAVLLGIHKAGAAYIPIDLDYPEDRVSYMLSDSQAQMVVTEEVFAGAMREVPYAQTGMLRPSTENIAYMIYTSGSTGRPKGVMIQHKALMNFIQFITCHFGQSEKSRISCHINFAFDASVEDLFPVFTVGGQLFIVPEEIRRDVYLVRKFIIDNRINGGNYSTQFGQLLAADEPLELDYINLGGEKMTAVPMVSGRIFNTYGPTEFTDDSTYFELDKEKTYRNIPIGKPLYNCTALVVDEYGQLLPWGAAGELCMAGPQMAKGYWNQPEMTAERFAPLYGMPEIKVYHTGDLVQWNSDCELEYLGRMDFQVKLRGFRIELGEIESVALEFPGVKQTAAEVRNDRICLYYTADAGSDRDGLRQHMSEKLAGFMVPSVYMLLDEMPHTPNGKIDRRALPEPSVSEEDITLPENEREAVIYELASGLMGHSGFGVTDDLISAGMSSLTAMRLSAALQRDHGIWLRVADIMRCPVIRQLADLAGLEEGREMTQAPLQEYPVREYYPLMENQRGVYLECELAGDATQYNNPAVYRFDNMSSERLAEAVRQTIDAHSYIKTVIRVIDGEAVLMRRDDEPAELTVGVLEFIPDEEYFSSRVKSFDLHADSLYRFEISECPDGVYLFMDIHHIIFDGLSSDIFMSDLLDACDGRIPEKERATAFEFALYERDIQAAGRIADAEGYFDRLAASANPASYQVSAEPDGMGAGLLSVSAERAAIDEHCRHLGVTASSFWHAAFAEALQRLTRVEDPLYMTVSNGRAGLGELDRSAGMFAKTLPVVLRSEGPGRGELSVDEYVRDMHSQLLESFSLDIYPYTRLVERHGIRPEIMFNYRGGLMDDERLAGLYSIQIDPDSVKFPLELTVYPEGHDYTLVVEYDRALYSRADMILLAEAVINTGLNMTVAEKIKDISLVSHDQQEALKELAKGFRYEYDRTETWIDLFLRRVGDHPDSEAVADAWSSMDYTQLHERSDRLAAWLIRKGVGPDDFVVVKMGRVKEFMVAVIGIHKAGAAYVPIDLELPEERAGYMLENSQAKVVVTEETVARALAEMDLEEAGRVLAEPVSEEMDAVEGSLSYKRLSPENVAYMIYTSGSTGRPKGVMIQHKALLNFVHCIRTHYNIHDGSRITLPKNFAFDASIEDMYPTLTKGGMLYIVSDEVRHDAGLMLRLIKEEKINGGGYPTQIGQMLAAEESLEVEYLTAGGEAMTLLPKAKGRVINVYGPTEFTDDSTFYEVEKGREYRNIPIGRPLYNNSSYIVDRYSQLLPQGAMGELCMAGPQMAKGYWRLPELTAEKFCILSSNVPVKVYHTGDLARWNDEGQLEYMGRFDFQVKLRGYRIELGEIEVRAGVFEGIEKKVAVVKNEQLCLYFTADRKIDTEELRAFMAETLAGFMVPSVYVQLDVMPLTPNGKINRGELPEPVISISDGRAVMPETDSERALFDIAGDVLKISGFGVTDNLISAGMNSLAAMRFSMEVQRRTDRELRVAAIMRTPVIRELAGMLDSGAADEMTVRLRPRPPQDYYPLTENQRGVYLDWEMNRDTTQYNIPLVYRFTDKDPERLAAAVEKAVDAHNYLKTGLAERDGEIVQERRDHVPALARVSELDTEPGPEYFQSRIMPFDLFEDRLYRFEITETPSAVYLFMDTHHIVFDGLSADVFLEDVMKAYDGREPEKETVTAWDHALYEKEVLAGGILDQADRYFDDLMSGAGTAVLPAGGRPDISGVRSVRRSVEGSRIHDFCRAKGITVSSYWHAAFSEAVCRITGEPNALYVTVSNGRSGAPGLEHTVGMFAKTLPVIARADNGSGEKETAADHAKAMHRQLQDTFDYDIYPYTRLVERHKLRAEMIFIYQEYLAEGGNLKELEEMDLRLDTVRFPLEIMIYPEEEDFTLSVQYDGSRYSELTAGAFADAIAAAAETMAGAVYTEEISLTSDEKLREVMELSGGERLEYNTSETWIDQFDAAAAEGPDRIAAVDAEGSYTYKELQEGSSRLARILIKKGIGAGGRAAVCMGRVRGFLLAVMAIHRAGAAYIPLDPDYPEDRIDYMVSDSGAGLVINESSLREMLDESGSVMADGIINMAEPDGLAYIIYTSGSTGKPKGVMQEHKALRAFTAWRKELIRPGSDSRHAEHASFAFDASLDDLICPLTWGGQVHILSDELRKDLEGMRAYFRENRISGLTMPTQLGMLMISRYPDLELDFLMMGGERLLPSAKTGVRLINGYGPTEFTVCSSFYEVDQERPGDIPVGRPVPNTYSFICDSRGGLLPKGLTGQLCLAGPQMSAGYNNMPEQTRASFTILNGNDIMVYCTGDMARWSEDGQLMYEGRRDSQVKLRGFRVEPGEIEAAAASMPGVRQTAAEVRRGMICLYYTAENRITREEMSAYLSEILAEHMMPSAFIQLDEMPLTANGKTDRKALPEPEYGGRGVYAGPAGQLEKEIALSMGMILGLDGPVSVLDSFFELGGDSIRAIRFVTLLRQKGLKISVSDVMKKKTVRAMADHCRLASQSESISQEAWTGQVPESAIMGYFRSLDLPHPEYFAQAVLLRCREKADKDSLRRAFKSLQLHHDMLRAAVREGLLEVRPPECFTEIEEISAGSVYISDTSALSEICSDIYMSIRMDETLIRPVLIHAADGDLFFITAHHLVTDGVSWRILISDLELAYRQALGGGETIKLPEKTSSYRDYVFAQRRYRDSYALRRQVSYWQLTEEKMKKHAETLSTGAGYEKTHIDAVMPEAVYAAVRAAEHSAYGIGANDLMITAVARSICRLTGDHAVSMQLEGHGREDIVGSVSTDRTVGWFTVVFPVYFEGIGAGDTGDDLLNVKEVLHRVPDRGIGYGILRYVSGSRESGLTDSVTPEISFNYLGEIDDTEDTESFFSQVPGVSADDKAASANGIAGPSLAVNCMVQAGRLRMSLDHDGSRLSPDEIHKLADEIMRELAEVSAFAAGTGADLSSASDYGENEWTREEFDRVREEFAGRGEKIERIYPLTPLQEGMLLKYLSEPDSRAYRLVDIYKLDVLPSEDALRRTLDRLASRHEVLRTAFIYDGVSACRQAVTDRMPGLIMTDLSGCDDPEAAVMDLREELLDTAFDLQRKPVLQAVCARISDDACFLLTVIHHIIVDGWCTEQYIGDFQSILDEEMKAGIRTDAAEHSADGRYEDAVREILAKDRDEALGYWRRLLDGYESQAVIPSWGRVPEAEQSPDDQVRICIDAESTGKLAALCRQAGATLSNGTELIWGLVLQTCSRTGDAVFAKVVSGRDGLETPVSDLVGLFINTIPVRVRTSENDTAMTLLRAMQVQTAESNPYDHCPLSEIQQLAGGGRLIQSVLAFENYDSGRKTADRELSYRMEPVFQKEETFGDIHLAAYTDEDERLCICMNYDRTLYRRSEMEAVLSLFRMLLEGIISDPDAPVKDIPLVDREEENAVMALSEGEKNEAGRTGIWLDMFDEQVRLHPDRMAVKDDRGSLTYSELDRQSEALAVFLYDRGAVRGDFIAVRTGRVKEFVTAVLAIHKAGAAYVPVDPAYPEERTAYMLEDSEASILLTEELIHEILADETYTCADRAVTSGKGRRTLRTNEEIMAARRPQRDDTAYMIYTSGSTGRPKGVMIHHAGLMNFTSATMKQNGLTPEDRIGHHFSFSFDSHIEDLFPVLSSGAAVYIMSEEIRREPEAVYRFLVENRITGGGYTTSMGRLMISGFELPQRYITCIGEPLNGVIGGDTEIINRYGPTECTNVAALYRLEKDREYGVIPVGRPMPEGYCFVVDRYGRLLPRGMAGELCYAGIQTGYGYWKQPEKTAQVFEDCPFVEGIRMYHTGDLARWNEEGQLVCLGRIDDQIKLRGYRIELSEVEAAAMEHDQVLQAAARVWNDRLCLYYTKNDDMGPDEEGLMGFLARRLADYMLPSNLIALECMPQTPNGKLDRRALPEPEAGVEIVNEPPATPAEAGYLEAAKEFLPGISFGVTDDLMKLGMNSVTVMRYVMKVSALGDGIRVTDVMRFRSIRGFLTGTGRICWIYGDEYDPEKPVLVSMQGIMPLNGMMPKYEGWSRRYNVLVFEPVDEHYETAFSGYSYDRLLDKYMELMMELLPEGADIAGFTGSSWGGELACQLAVRYAEASGSLPFTVMLDTFIGAGGQDQDIDDDMSSQVYDQSFLRRFDGRVSADDFVYKYRLMDMLEKTSEGLMPYEGRTVYVNAWKDCPPEDMEVKLASLDGLFSDLEIIDMPESDHYDLFLDPGLNSFYDKLLSELTVKRESMSSADDH